MLIASEDDFRVQLELWGEETERSYWTRSCIGKQLIQQNQLFGRKSQISEISAASLVCLGGEGGEMENKVHVRARRESA